MTTDDRVTELANRVDKLETNLWAELKEINAKLSTMAVQAASKSCPDPGACILLRAELATVRAQAKTDHEAIMKLDRWQAWLTGIGVCAIFTLTLFGPTLRKLFKLE